MGEECDRLLEQLADLLHGEVTAETKAALEEHLRSCPPCFERADFQAGLRQLIVSRCSEPVPEGLRTKVLAILKTDVPPGDSGQCPAGP
jgi:anti-sigma factor (TIGR02949 family)